MAGARPMTRRKVNQQSLALAREWRRLGRAATFVAVLTSPVLFVALHQQLEWSVPEALLGTIGGIAVFRGLVAVLAHPPRPAPAPHRPRHQPRRLGVLPP